VCVQLAERPPLEANHLRAARPDWPAPSERASRRARVGKQNRARSTRRRWPGSSRRLARAHIWVAGDRGRPSCVCALAFLPIGPAGMRQEAGRSRKLARRRLRPCGSAPAQARAQAQKRKEDIKLTKQTVCIHQSRHRRRPWNGHWLSGGPSWTRTAAAGGGGGSGGSSRAHRSSAAVRCDVVGCAGAAEVVEAEPGGGVHTDRDRLGGS
jgi:hypothetical protein